MTPRRNEVAGVVLTGGQSSRMGMNKALLPLGKKPLWQIAAEIISPFTDTVLFVGAVAGFEPPEQYSLYPDMPADLGPLGGIATGLEASGYSHHLVIPVDSPFIQPGLLQLLLDRASGVKAVCGQSSEQIEPLIAYYHKDCAPVIRMMLHEGNQRAHELFKRVPSVELEADEVRKVDPELRSYRDLDSPDDLVNALLLQSGI